MTDRVDTSSQRRRRIGVVIIIAAIALLAFWAVRSRGARQTLTETGSATRQASTGMAGMTASASGVVQLSGENIREFGVTFGTAAIRALVAETRTTGVVTVDETRLAQVTPKIGGYVERLYVNATGQAVSRGQPMLELYSPELLAAQQELLLSEQLQQDMGRTTVPGVVGSATDLVAASRRRLELLDISQQQIDGIIRTKRVRRTLTLFAPVTGIVIDKKVMQGQAIAAGAALFTIADLRSVWIDVQLREADASAVRIGSGADIQVAGMPERTLKGSVAFVYPLLDSTTRAVRARVAVANPGGALKPGMYATVQMRTSSRSALTVPSTAILRTGERDVVFMDMRNGTLMPMDVRTGRVAREYTEILSGLEPGARVVTSAQFLLDSESNLGEVMKSMIGQSGGDGKGMGDMPMPAAVTPKR